MKYLVLVVSITILGIVASCSKTDCPDPDPTPTPTPTESNDNLKIGLAGHYPFTGNAGDSSGFSNDGVVNGAVLTADRFSNANRAYSFDGADDYISISSVYFQNGKFTYAAWLRTASASLGTPISIGGTTGGDQAMISHSSLGFVGTSWNTNATSSLVSVGSMPTLSTWYHVVITRDDSNLKLFVDGQLVTTTAVTGLTPTYGNNPVYAFIGARVNSTQFFNGVMDDVRLYNRALSAAEVLQLYELN